MRALASQFVVALTAILSVGQATGQNATSAVPQAAETVSVQGQSGAASSIVTRPNAAQTPHDQLPVSQSVSSQPAVDPTVAAAGADSPAVRILESFKDSDIKFNLPDLMDTLRDKRHEGWVLAAYPDPKTGHPLIGAGFTLDLPERQHA